ncbi:AcrR family transcriptional regulator [Microbacterium sp. ZKA21]|uniref:TetR/AcrR family transcriptional regulator n=1 Tax=Microbacterium sp. ZKA21 TaxID=3381694 RepID=UPI003D2036AE
MHSQEDRALRQLWELEPATTRGPKARWTLSEVTAAAVSLADEAGLDAVSLARVAERLDIVTTAIYRYVDAKATLVELMVDSAIGDPPDITGSDWRDRCRFWVTSLAEKYAEHAWLSDVRPTRMPTQPRAYAWIDALVRSIRDDVHADPLRVALLLDSLIRSYSTLGATAGQSAPPEWLGEAIADRYPAMADAAGQDTSDSRAELEFAVEAVLRGLR